MAVIQFIGIVRNSADISMSNGQFCDRNLLTVNEVVQHVSCSDRRKLVRVTNQNESSAVRYQTQQHAADIDINHGYFIAYDKFVHAVCTWPIHDAHMNRIGWESRNLSHSGCCASGRCAQKDIFLAVVLTPSL